MPTFITVPDVTYLGAYNQNVSEFVSIDIAVTNKDITFDPAGNVQNVTGNQKLIQDIMLFLLSPVGVNLVDLTWGNKSLGLLGNAISYRGQVEALITSAITDLQRFKSMEQQRRGALLEASELIRSVTGVSISSTSPTDNTIQIAITIETTRGDIVEVNLPL